MFIRETIRKKAGKAYKQHQLIRSVRTASGPRQEIVLNMKQLDLDKSKWKDLANAIEEKLLNQTNLFNNTDSEIDKLADHYSAVIIQNRLNTPSVKENTKETLDPDYKNVDINSVKTSTARDFGGENLVYHLMKEYQIDRLFNDLNLTKKQQQHCKMLIAGRMLHPASERETSRWLNKDSSLPEIVKFRGKIYDTALHRAAIKLLANHHHVEDYLSDKARDLFSLDEKIILYDLTNTYFEGSKRNSTIAKRGKSKERRDDCPLLSLAMTIDSEGFPKRSKIYEGNISEASTLETVLSQISFGDTNKRKTIVMDSGIATENNLEKIKPHYDYIAVSRKRTIPYEKWDTIDEEKIILKDNKTTLTMKSLEVGDEVYLLCHSEAKEKKEQGIIKRRQSKFETELKNLAEGLHQPRKMKNYEKVLEKIGRLKEKYKVGQYYDIKVRRNKNKATSIIFSKNSKGQLKSKHVGEYLLRTNRKDLSNREISQIHRSLTMIEASFRSMKSDLGLRPIYHQNDKCSEAHLYISVIAYHFVAAILKQLQGNGINLTWDSVRKILASRKRVTTTFNTKEGEIISIRTNTTPNLEQAAIYQIFKRLKPAIGDAKHMIKLK